MAAHRPVLAIVGAGAVGRALGRALRAAGYSIAAVLSRSQEAARALAAQVAAPVASGALEDLPGEVRLVFCCVPDDVLPGLAEQLALVPHDWPHTVVAHTSGALPAQVLAPVGRRGAALLSFHPVQSFPRQGAVPSLAGIAIGLEGDPQAVALGREVAQALGARPVELSAETKPRYHLAATLASNGLGALMAVAGEVLASIGLSRPEAHALLLPLVEGTLHNLKQLLPEEALTGPAVRGDLFPISQHLQALRQHLPHLLPVYAALTTEMIRVGVRSGRLAPSQATAILERLQEALDSMQDMPPERLA
ncbi:Rossmann-like and DUF2520 domain-containing protein [Rhodothermus profundi]|uniref:Predicted oxidoreductase, contains short-chain dehydrogenase (SDR) and DUF2520 domains n=1 Tax=Rhodothermus profundi TaxID=633813 RepID=A0A1M6VXT2_9BACT|nr:Rossmann-like and DUF2520 domain-containing protein [Rhodothermus profundi]SHK86332.1 Predicted oxidoreductase, contains short-chain dehydrogenase (SDR) and DUF2520 domains [Rhodothermus profundi]